MRKTSISVENISITPLVSSIFGLDGGTMFGIVPKVLWEKEEPSDKENRIKLNVNSILIETESSKILVEAGMGKRFSEKEREIYALREWDVVGALAEIGVEPEDIDIVILSHLHFDHAGGATEYDKNKRLVPVFPRARHVIQKSEWEEAINPHPLAMNSYRKEDFLPLKDYELLELVDGKAEVAPGVRVEHTGGHTPGHQVVWMGDDDVALYPGDLAPTIQHLRLRWLMSWDMDPRMVFEEKRRILSECSKMNGILLLTHDPDYFACRVSVEGDLKFKPVEDSVVGIA
ncbi:MAG: MBL fold metallo-hydrolase [Actinomycetota bacterium]|nr:MBL fold metallo-hydrolase [Actinomycetota bacterium]